MRNKKYCRSAMILLDYCIVFIVAASVFAQSPTRQKSKIKNFGSSLKKSKEKGKDSSEKSNIADEETIRIKTDLVVSDVLVVNQKGNAVLGLKQSDFVVAEDGTEQKVELFTFGENSSVPRSIVLIIDYSGNLPFYIENSVNAAKMLVDKLNPQDKMAVVTDEIKLLSDFTNDKTRLKSVLESVKKRDRLSSDGNRGEAYSALLAVLNELFDTETVRPIVIFQSGGGELFLLKPIAERFSKYYRQRNFSFNDLQTAIEKSRATIYSIIPQIRLVELSKEEREINIKKMHQITSDTVWAGKKRPPELIKEMLKFFDWEMPANQAALIEISKLSGGYADFLEKAEDAETAYSSIFTVINNRYVIGYYPTNQERDGKRRNVKIEVRGHPEYIVVGRKTYFIPKQEK